MIYIYIYIYTDNFKRNLVQPDIIDTIYTSIWEIIRYNLSFYSAANETKDNFLLGNLF